MSQLTAVQDSNITPAAAELIDATVDEIISTCTVLKVIGIAFSILGVIGIVYALVYGNIAVGFLSGYVGVMGHDLARIGVNVLDFSVAERYSTLREQRDAPNFVELFVDSMFDGTLCLACTSLEGRTRLVVGILDV